MYSIYSLWFLFLLLTIILIIVFQFSQVNIDEPLFQPFPSEVYFQNFEPFETYQVPLILRNNDKVSECLNFVQYVCLLSYYKS